jgi:hypothetical protein
MSESAAITRLDKKRTRPLIRVPVPSQSGLLVAVALAVALAVATIIVGAKVMAGEDAVGDVVVVLVWVASSGRLYCRLVS